MPISVKALLNNCCPKCGSEEFWQLSQSQKRRCKKCRHDYSITSGTEFDSHKLPLEAYDKMLALATDGRSWLSIARETGLNYKTVWSRLHALGVQRRSRRGRRPKNPIDETLQLAIAELEREAGMQEARDRLQRRIAKASAGVEPRPRPKPLPYTRGFDQD